MEPNTATDIKYILRQMAWERAKGELRALLATYVGEREQYESAKASIDAFMIDFKDNHG